MKFIASKRYQRVTNFALAALLVVSTLTASVPFLFSQKANALETAVPTAVVTAKNLQGWTKYTDTGTPLEFVADQTAPLGAGALKLSTPGNNEWIMLDRNAAPSSEVNAHNINVSYASKRLSGPAHAAPAYVLAIDKDGDLSNSSDTFWAWYEPVYNNSTTTNYDQWNTWGITAQSRFWYNGAVPAGLAGYTQTLESALTNLPNAKVVGFTLNMGTGNGGWSALVDNVKTPEATYDFEPTPVAKPTTLKTIAQNGKDITNGVTNVNYISNSWAPVTGAVSYNYEFRKPASLPTFTRNQTGTSIAGQFHNGSSPEGTYGFRVQAVDANDVKSPWSDWSNVTYDTTVPDVAITSPSANQVVKGSSLTIQGSATDTHAFNYFYCYVTLPGSSEVGIRGADCNTTWSPVTNNVLGTVNLSGLHDGNYEAHLVGYDKAGNHSDLSYAVPFTLDNTPPAAPVITNSPITINRTMANAQATWSHNGVDVDHYEYREYMSQAAADADANGDTASYWIVEHAASDKTQTVGQSWTGEHTLYYRVVAIDAAGNRSIPSQLGTVVIDKVAPLAPINGLPAATNVVVAVTPTPTFTVTPAITSPAAAVLGATTDTPNSTGAADVKGATDDKTAVAVNSDANQGKIFGLAWYWWILILAALTTIAWYIAAAVRRRNDGNA